MTASRLKAAFHFECIVVPLDKLLPTRSPAKVRASDAFPGMVAAVRELGLIEPLSVYPQKGGRYLLLDGHMRVEALRDLGKTDALCLVADTQEGYTYNDKVNRIAPIQRNRMILRTLEAGVSEERLARTLNQSVSTVRGNRSMLQGICTEAIEVLRDKAVAQGALTLLKKVKPLRQMEIADIMVAAGNYSAPYARALVMTTPKDHLVDPETPKKIAGVKPEDLARIEHEARVQENDFRMIDESYNEQVMALTLARGYLRGLLDNNRVVKFMAQNSREFLTEFQRIVESKALEA